MNKVEAGKMNMSVYVGIAFSYACGVILSELDFGLALLFSLIFFTFVGVLSLAGKVTPSKMAYAVMLFLGVIFMSYISHPCENVIDSYIGRYIEVEGVICEMPDEYGEYNSYVADVGKISYRAEETVVNTKIRITSNDLSLQTGNKVAFRGFLKEIEGASNSTDFDYKRYYKSKGIELTMHAEETSLLATRSIVFSPMYLSEYIKSRIGTAIDRFYKNDSAAMLKAVILGNRAGFTDDFELVLKRTSAMRFLYPSYLHLYFLLSAGELIFAFLPRKKREAAFVAVALAFAIFNGTLAVFVKATIMLCVVLLYKKIRGFSQYGDMLAIVLTICLVVNPLLIYNSGFVISVTAGVLLELFKKSAESRLCFIKAPYVRTAVAMWIVTTIGLLPLMAYYFNGAPIYSIIFTLIYTPLSALLYITAPLALLLYEVLNTASLVGVFVNGLIQLMKTIPQMVSYLPGYYIILPKMTAFGFVAVIDLFFLFKLLADGKRKELKFKAGATFLAILLVCRCGAAFAERGRMYVTFVNVGQGDGAIIEIKGKNTILLDGGGASAMNEYDVGEKVFLPYLTAKGHNKIDLAIVSHCHSDHIDGIIAAVENLAVRSIMLPSESEKNAKFQELISVAEKRDIVIQYANAGDKLKFNSGLVIDVLSPSAESEDENDNSLVLRFDYNGTKMFFGGDIGSKTERELRGRIGGVDIAKVSHHGSKYSSRSEFIEEASPSFAVFSVGENNPYGHPSERVVRAYAESGARILRTDKMKDIVLRCDGNGKIGAGWYGEG